MRDKEIFGDSVLLLGYGEEGKSTHQYLLEHHPDKKIGIADQQKVEPISDLPVELHTGKKYLDSLCHYDVIVRSPGVPSQLPELQRCLESGKKLTSATNIFFSECPGTIVAITGTKGKSTTTSLTTHILQKEYPDVRAVANIGKPALDYLPRANRETIFVAELSNFQLEDIRYSPHIAVILNIVPEHLDRYDNFNQYVQTKAQIIRHQTPEDIVIFNPEHQLVSQIASSSPARKFRFSLSPREEADVYLEQENIYFQRKNERPQFILNRKEIPLLGEGNVENTLAAISVALFLKVPLEKIRKAIPEFKPLEHRLEFVGQRQAILFYNDSIATIPEATIHGLKALGKEVETLIAGGHERGLDFAELGKFLNQTQVKTLILFPETGKRIWQAVCQAIPAGKRPQKYDVSSMEEAVKIAFEKTSPGKICLLSPASASFGLFRDFKQRGNLFKKLVLEKEVE